jgi:hypothetical protein
MHTHISPIIYTHLYFIRIVIDDFIKDETTLYKMNILFIVCCMKICKKREIKG